MRDWIAIYRPTAKKTKYRNGLNAALDTCMIICLSSIKQNFKEIALKRGKSTVAYYSH